MIKVGEFPAWLNPNAAGYVNLSADISAADGNEPMVGRYLKSLLLVLMFGGLIGPIFLIVYFVFETPFDRQSTGWMAVAGLVVTAADVLVALAVTSNNAKRVAKSAVLERDGVLALAQSTGMSETGTAINDQPVVKLALHIAGPGFAFDTHKRAIASVTRLGNFNARKLVVLVDPVTNEYEIDWERSALVNGLEPSAAQRLQELNSLRAMEAITEDEYAEKRRRIIAEI